MRKNDVTRIALAVILLLGNILLFNALFSRVRGARVDLTEGRIYTLAPETREILKEPEEPLEIFFFHTALDRMHEKLRPLIGPMTDIVREFEAASGGRVTARIVETDTADAATMERASTTFGVRPAPLQMQTSDEDTVRNTYFSLVVAYGDQFERFDMGALYEVKQVGAGLDIEVRLQNIEYILAKSIHKVVRGFQSIGAALATQDGRARIELFFSPDEELPDFMKKIPAHAEKAAKKLAADAMGRLKWEKTTVADADPQRLERLQQRLYDEFGIRPIPTDLFSEKGVYSWAVVSALGKTARPIILVRPGEDMTEFEVRDALEGQLKVMIPGFLTTVGVMTPDAAQDPMAGMMGQPQRPKEYAEMVAALRQEYDVTTIDVTEGRPIPRQITVLVIVRPAEYSDKALYEIDQFLMRGGRLVVCADAHVFDLDRVLQERGTATNKVKHVAFDAFRKFLRHMGADVGDAMIRDEKSSEVIMQRPGGRRGEGVAFEVKSPYFVVVEGDESFDRDNDIVRKQRLLVMPWATPVRIATPVAAADGQEAQPGVPAGVVAREIIWTSPAGSLSTDIPLAESLNENSAPYKAPADAARQPVGVVLTGTFPSYFAGKPAPLSAKEEEKIGAASRPAEQPSPARLDQSRETSIVVIGDSDSLSTVVAQVFDVAGAWRHNFAFLRNAIDFGGSDAILTPIRNREVAQRPLTAMRALDADQRASKTWWSRALALTIPCVALLLLGACWAVMRRARHPMDLPRAAS